MTRLLTRLSSSRILLLTTITLSAQAPVFGESNSGPIRDASVLLLKASHEQQRLIDPVTYAIGRMTLDDAYTVQDRLCRDRKEPVIGYKLAFASSAAQRRWNIDAPVSGRLFASGRVPEGGTLEAASFRKFMIEAEIAFIVAGDIRAPVTSVDALREQTASVHLALDIIDMPFSSENAPPTVEDIVCANAAASHVMLGEPMPASEATALSGFHIRMSHDGKDVYMGDSSAVMGDPWNAYLWLSRHLIQRGTPLKKGDIVLSGAVAAAYSGSAGRIQGDYVATAGALGELLFTLK
jgi:2-keto-4-pentenoate hydratase